ncbi:MAG: ATP-binding cassette domain-containing protein [Pseudomonadota bacterium]
MNAIDLTSRPASAETPRAEAAGQAMKQLSVRVDAKSYPPVEGRPALPVLAQIDLHIDDGSFVIITGPSGCGKSTLLNIVAGLDQDYEGALCFAQSDPQLSYMFQTPRLLPWRTVRENIELVLPSHTPDRASRIDGMLSAVGLRGQETQYPERLSLGMQRRAALARAFITEPDILLMDEPFVSLDAPTAQTLREILTDLWQRRPTTVLFVTHDRDEAVMLGTRLIRVGGEPAKVVSDQLVSLSNAERADPAAVQRAKQELFAA